MQLANYYRYAVVFFEMLKKYEKMCDKIVTGAGHLRGCDFGGPLCEGGSFQPCSNFTDIRNLKNVVQ